MSQFDYLTARIRIPINCPDELKNGIAQFYADPNNKQWGDHYSRVLYHETIHFWQVLSSGYIANVLSNEWLRLLWFETNNEIKPVTDQIMHFRERNSQPFSPQELAECWARFWDVHTRNPETILAEEGLVQDYMESLNTVPNNKYGYSGEAYDYLMLKGNQYSTYEAPYKWLLKSLSKSQYIVTMVNNNPEHVKKLVSYLAVLIFPVVVHGAFGSKDPVLIYKACINELINNKGMLNEIISKKPPGGRINLDWLNSWEYLKNELVAKVLRHNNMPDFTSGLDVISRGHLIGHPIYASYINQISKLKIRFELENKGLEDSVSNGNLEDLDYRFHICFLANDDVWAVFGQPGQPNYRMILGEIMKPPMIEFDDFILYPNSVENIESQYNKEPGSDSWQNGMKEFIHRVDQFRSAEFAVQNGLSIDAFAR